MKIVTNNEGLRFAVPTTKKEQKALKELKYDLFTDYENSPEWCVLNLGDDKKAWEYMLWMYRDWYFINRKDICNAELSVERYDSVNIDDTVEVSYYRVASEWDKQTDMVIDGIEYKYSSDRIGDWIPSNYMALVAYYRMKGKFRKVAMLLKKYGKDSVMPGLHL